MAVELEDFVFWRLRIASGRLIVGFGRALNIGTSQLQEALSHSRTHRPHPQPLPQTRQDPRPPPL